MLSTIVVCVLTGLFLTFKLHYHEAHNGTCDLPHGCLDYICTNRPLWPTCLLWLRMSAALADDPLGFGNWQQHTFVVALAPLVPTPTASHTFHSPHPI
ncbi:hypothetical protein V6N12_022228 [Hibiscus sabdariffa]|uniref:Secreted protein n=1 Tax=Hibiscus sabdariffa TaxID=183260 RepID=A0ABR2FU04_9ROSI